MAEEYPDVDESIAYHPNVIGEYKARLKQAKDEYNSAYNTLMAIQRYLSTIKKEIETNGPTDSNQDSLVKAQAALKSAKGRFEEAEQILREEEQSWHFETF